MTEIDVNKLCEVQKALLPYNHSIEAIAQELEGLSQRLSMYSDFDDEVYLLRRLAKGLRENAVATLKYCRLMELVSEYYGRLDERLIELQERSTVRDNGAANNRIENIGLNYVII